MRFLAKLAVLGASLVALSAHAQCNSPAIVEVPDGSTSTLDEMLAAQTAVREYMTAMEEFLECINTEIEGLAEDAPEETRTALVERHNTGVTEMEALATTFNEERIAYQEANQ